MKKSKCWLAVFLAALMTLTPVAGVYAANPTVVTVSENESTVVVAETEEQAETVEESVEEVTETEETTEEISGETVEETTEEVTEESGETVESTEEVEEDTVVEETTGEVSTEEVTTEEKTTEEETTEEVTTEEVTTEDETTEEATTEEETTEEFDEHSWNDSDHKEPELEMKLSAAMVAEKQELQGTVKRLIELEAGRQYIENQAIFLADSKSFANEVAEGYGATLDSDESGVAVIAFEDDVIEIISMAEDMEVLLPAVYPNYIYTIYDDIVMEYALADGEENVTTGISNDTEINKQSYHTDVKTAAAWAYNNTAGKGIKVAVIDSGIDKDHVELKGRSTATVTYATPYNMGGDNNRHGTHVSGIIAAKKDNQMYGAGIAHNASILSIKALEQDPRIKDKCNGSTDGIIKAVNKAVSSGARVINMSLGGAYYDSLFEATVDKAVNKGVVVVAAAGNDGKKLSDSRGSATFYSPACFANVITVSATTTGSAGLAYFSNYGNGIIDIAAPGTGIWSSVPDIYGDYDEMSGTSQATPQVAAAAAYILSVNPILAKSKTKATVDTVTEILKASATKGSYNNSTYYGAGLLNVEAAVKMAAPSNKNNSALQAPSVMVGGQPVVAGQTIQDTDTITLSSALGITANANIKIYYTTNGKDPKETAENLYTGSFKIAASGNKTIKAMAVYYGTKSKVVSTKVKVNAYVTNFDIVSNTGVMSVASGKSLQLSATNIAPTYATNKAITWAVTTGNEFATISKGKITAKKGITEKQTVTVQATMQKAGGTIAKLVSVTILPVASKLELTNKADATCTVTYPATIKMNLTVTPAGINPPISYTSSNAKVTKVNSSGTIIAVGSGKATITAKTLDGSGKSAKMTVTVIKPVQNVSVKSKTGVYAIAAGKSLTLVADVTADATNKKVNWTVAPVNQGASMDGISIKNGTLSTKTSVKAITDVKVTATAADGSGRSGSVTVRIYPSTTKKVALEGGSIYNLGTKAIGTLKTSVQLLPYTDGYTTDFMGRKQGSGNTNLSNFTYKSSNTKVATVSSSGLVSIVGAAGSAKITITANDGSKKSTTCTVKVVKPVTAMSLASKSGVNYVGRGKSLSLVASINTDATNKKLEWFSMDTSIATVNSKGKVTGKGYDKEKWYSEVIIRAEAQDGSGIYQDFIVSIEPPVSKLYLPIDRYGKWVDWNEEGEGRFNTSASTTMRNGMSMELPMVYFASPDFDGVSWADDRTSISYSNSNVIQFNWYAGNDGEIYGLITAVNKGTAKITYKALDGSGKKATLTIKVK